MKNHIIAFLLALSITLSYINYDLKKEASKNQRTVIKVIAHLATFDKKILDYFMSNYNNIHSLTLTDHGAVIEHKKNWR